MGRAQPWSWADIGNKAGLELFFLTQDSAFSPLQISFEVYI
jgi:hypothetical protein